MTEKEVRDIVKSVLKGEMSNALTKDQVKKIAKEESEKISKEMFTKEEIKDMIRKTFFEYHKWMWEKKNVWINQI